MTMLNELQNAINQLEQDKNDLFAKIQQAGWKDERYKNKVIRESRTDLDDFITISMREEKRLLPYDIGSLYQRWYSAAKTIIENNQPSRTAEFENAYLPHAKDESPVGIKNIIALRYITKIDQLKLMDLINAQFDILAAVSVHLQFLLYDVELTAYAILMDDEINAAGHLLKSGFVRPAGSLAGVILERHLKNLLRKHNPPIEYREKDMLGSLNDLCKETVYDLLTWRKVQRFADVRNYCDHDK